MSDEACADPESSESSSTSSPSSTVPDDTQHESMNELLESFRQQWHRELKPNEQAQEDAEAMARRLFLQGAAREAEGRLHEATSCYRRALQLVPDIEVRVYASQQLQEKQQQQRVAEPAPQQRHRKQQKQQQAEGDEWENLVAKFQRLRVACAPTDDNSVQGSCHVSRLPPEVLLLVLRWVVSCELDLRSLESCSAVCRAFYLAARDPEIWRLICSRVWGSKQVKRPSGVTWRDHFISQPRIHFHGCYISRTSYIRPGEQSFQELYRLWHAVEYYRYVRFFPGGRVLMLTSAEEPAAAVGHLRGRQSRNPAVLSGVYKLCETRVMMQLHPAPTPQATNNNIRYVRGRRVQAPPHDSGERIFHVELEIVRGAKNRNSSQLSWHRYCVETRYRTAPGSLCPFELSPGKFPPLWFSRVRSYATASEACLE